MFVKNILCKVFSTFKVPIFTLRVRKKRWRKSSSLYAARNNRKVGNLSGRPSGGNYTNFDAVKLSFARGSLTGRTGYSVTLTAR